MQTEGQNDLFHGADIQPARDNARLKSQMDKVFDVMKDGKRRTVRTLARMIDEPETSVSAQLRNLRKDRFGAHDVQRHSEGNGLYSYSMTVSYSDTPHNPALRLPGQKAA